jgi:hypothetical protein
VPSALSGDRQALRDLLARRYPAAARVPMLLSDDLWIHAVIGTPYVNAFPLSFAPQDSLVPIGANSALAAVRALPFGTELVMEADVERLEGLRRAMAGTLCERGSLILEEAVERVVVVRNAEGRGGGDVCRRWGMVAVP